MFAFSHLDVATTYNNIGVVRVVVQSSPFGMKMTNDQMALVIAKTLPTPPLSLGKAPQRSTPAPHLVSTH